MSCTSAGCLIKRARQHLSMGLKSAFASSLDMGLHRDDLQSRALNAVESDASAGNPAGFNIADRLLIG